MLSLKYISLVGLVVLSTVNASKVGPLRRRAAVVKIPDMNEKERFHEESSELDQELAEEGDVWARLLGSSMASMSM
jgi:hypothetical protein